MSIGADTMGAAATISASFRMMVPQKRFLSGSPG